MYCYSEDVEDILEDLAAAIYKDVEENQEGVINKLKNTIKEQEQEIADLKSGRAYKKLETKYDSLKADCIELKVNNYYLSEKNQSLMKIVAMYEEKYNVGDIEVNNIKLEEN